MDPLRLSAETQGFFTRTDAFSAGHDDNSIRRALKVRLWTRVRAGAYTYPELWPSDAESRHRIRGRAVAGKLGVDVALSHTTSSIVHDLRHWQVDLDLVHVTRLDAGAGRTESGVVHHSGLVLPSDLVEEHGIRRTHAARAAIETASLTSTESALVTLDSALQLGKCTRDELDATYRLMQCWPGMRRVQVAVRLADAGAQSVGESRSRYLFYSLGLPAPRLQYEVFDASGRLVGITDFAWPELGLLGEFDGKVKYGRLLRDGDEPGDAVFREKVREDWLREVTGWRLVRLTWADLYQPQATASRIRRQFLAAA
jgi:hypothetical protein